MPQPQEIVRIAPEEVTIETPNPEIVYVPVCDPSAVYGAWPYPDYPPYFFGNFFKGTSPITTRNLPPDTLARRRLAKSSALSAIIRHPCRGGTTVRSQSRQ